MCERLVAIVLWLLFCHTPAGSQSGGYSPSMQFLGDGSPWPDHADRAPCICAIVEQEEGCCVVTKLNKSKAGLAASYGLVSIPTLILAIGAGTLCPAD